MTKTMDELMVALELSEFIDIGTGPRKCTGYTKDEYRIRMPTLDSLSDKGLVMFNGKTKGLFYYKLTKKGIETYNKLLDTFNKT